MWPELATGILTVIEIGGLVAAAFLLFRSSDASLAEAAAYACFLPLMALSFSFQLVASNPSPNSISPRYSPTASRGPWPIWGDIYWKVLRHK